MAYPEILSRRIPYDINGTAVGLGRKIENGITEWLTPTQLGNLNSAGNTASIATTNDYKSVSLWFFLPERMEIEKIFAQVNRIESEIYFGTLRASNDTTNGMDGTWETAQFPSGLPSTVPGIYAWRTALKPVSLSTTYRVICAQVFIYVGALIGLNLYGRKAAGERPDDILFVNLDGTEKTALKDWGDRPEGTTVIDSFKLKNASLTKIANGVNLQLNHGDMSLSFSEEGPWTPALDITSIAPNSLSSTIYVRHLLGPPLLILGPRAGRTIVTVGSWV